MTYTMARNNVLQHKETTQFMFTLLHTQHSTTQHKNTQQYHKQHFTTNHISFKKMHHDISESRLAQLNLEQHN